MDLELTPHLKLAQELTDFFSTFASVEAVALAGSQTNSVGDSQSDIDLYVYTSPIIPLEARRALAESRRAAPADLNLTFWDPGDEWMDGITGIEADIMFWEPAWIEDQIERVLGRFQASTGYSTCFWHTIRNSRALFDRRGWFAALQDKAAQPYPEALRRAVIAKNHPLLRTVIPAYSHQIEKALRRGDLVSVNHRTAAYLASYFDTLFALNRIPNPGEKRLVSLAQQRCPLLPKNMGEQIEAVLRTAGSGDPALLRHLDALADGLDDLLRAEGMDPKTTLTLAD